MPRPLRDEAPTLYYDSPDEHLLDSTSTAFVWGYLRLERPTR